MIAKARAVSPDVPLFIASMVSSILQPIIMRKLFPCECDTRERKIEGTSLVTNTISILGFDKLEVLRLQISQDAEEMSLRQEIPDSTLVQRVAEQITVSLAYVLEGFIV